MKNIQTKSWFGSVLGLALIAITTGSVRRVQANPCDPSAEGNVGRAMFTTHIENREPADQVLILDNSYREVFFFTDLNQFQGHTITHRWEFEGRVVQSRSYPIKSSRWRAVSQKDLDPAMVGRWSVLVMDENECPLKAVVFQYVQHSANQKQTAILPAGQ
ncbi:MAG: DUF2914 domain-containing protein [Gammaproteobacteria bacterium]|nr:DUF2914 domain-containing protein [Gammaproteobacteria bacterium]